jgi:hypothetical protein
MTSQQGRGAKCWSVCAAWVHPSMPACRLWHAGMLACGSMASGQRGGQECWDVCGVCMSHRTGNKTPTDRVYSTRRISLEVPRSMAMGGHRPECQHASMPACYNRVAGMPGCTPAAQTDKCSSPVDHRPASQHDSMPPTWVLVCL